MPFEAECVAGFTRLLESDPFLVGQKFVMHIRRDGIRLGRADADMPGSLEPGGRLRSSASPNHERLHKRQVVPYSA